MIQYPHAKKVFWKDHLNTDWNLVISIVFYSHFIIDLIKCRFRNKLYKGKEIEIDVDFDCEDEELRKHDIFLLYIDQILHVAIIMALYTSMI